MKLTVWGFPLPTRLDDIEVGTIFQAGAGEEKFLCQKVVDDQGQFYIVLHGSMQGGSSPRVISERAIWGYTARLPPFDLIIEPVGDRLLAPTENSANGSLLIDGRGDPWIHVIADERFRFWCSLSTGSVGVPPAPHAVFSAWRLVLRDGDRSIQVLAFGG